jgi:hypothetical protein
MPPIATPFPEPDFHFSDPARDAQYLRLQREVDRALAIFRQSADAARHAIFPQAARPSMPAQPGTTAWLQARAAVERAIRDRRAVRDALMAMIAFVGRERPNLPQAEVEYALDVRHVSESTLQGTSDTLVYLLARLAGITVQEWPA